MSKTRKFTVPFPTTFAWVALDHGNWELLRSRFNPEDCDTVAEVLKDDGGYIIEFIDDLTELRNLGTYPTAAAAKQRVQELISERAAQACALYLSERGLV